MLLGKYNNGDLTGGLVQWGVYGRGIYGMGVHRGGGVDSSLFLLAILARYRVVYINFQILISSAFQLIDHPVIRIQSQNTNKTI